MDNVYKCRLCYRMYHDKEVVIDLSSEEAKKEEIRAKILSALSIIVTDHDSLKYICRICYGQVEVNFQFTTKCRINNAKYIESLEHSPSNDVVRAEYYKFMKIPISALFNQYQSDVKGLFDAVTSFLNDNSENLRHFENVGINNHNSITTQFDIENDQSVGNGIPESYPVLEVNVPSTNEHNINTNNIDNSTTSSTPRKIILSSIPVISTNNSSNTINPGGNVYRIITNGPNVRTNNVNNRLVMNNTNQSRTNFPIVCKNNVIKSSRFCVLSNRPSPLLVNRRRVEKSTVQNLGSATRLNQSNVNIPSTVRSTVNIHNNSVQLNGNGEINEISDDEVICLDDDDDEDDDIDSRNHNDNNNNGRGNNNNGDGNNLQSLANSINPLNQWVTSQPQIIHTNNKNNNVRTNIRNPYQYKNKKKLIQFRRKCLLNLRKVIYLRNNAPSTNIPSAVEMTVTPDMPISTSDMGSPLNLEEEYIDVDSEPSESLPVEPEQEPVPEPGPSRVLPDTGFHFLFSTDETVDLTTKEDTTPIKIKPIMRQKKTPKPRKAVASKKQTQKTSIAQQDPKEKIKLLRSSTSSTIEKKQTRKTSIAECKLKSKSQLLGSSISPNAEQSDTSLTKARPKRASAIDSAAEIKNSGLYKLGKHIEGRNGNWLTNVTHISLPMFQCPICHKFYYSLKSRQAHETSMHSSLLETIHEPVNIVSSPGNSACTQQLYLFNYLQLCQTSKNKTETVHQLAKRTLLLKAFNSKRNKIIGFFQCTYCPFDTNLIFACWAHMSSSHLNCVSEKKSCLFCFLCSRILTKRTTMLKHLDGCIIKQYALPIDNSCDQFMCVHCDDSFDSLIELDDHTWAHVDGYNY